jgi:Dolichyl-phosphate-mannose-protein mannosyltransferase
MHSTRSRSRLLVIGALVVMLAGFLRFHRLGDWPFAGDEILTFPEVDSLFEGASGSAVEQKDRLPRLIPLGYLVHYLDYQLFGRDEYGSRVLMALVGTASVAVIFFGLAPTLGRSTALAAAALTALWPEHLFQSQQNRFYAAAQFFAAVCMVTGALAVSRRSASLALASCAAAVAALLSHTLQGMLFAGLFGAIAMAAVVQKRDRGWKLLIVVGAAGLLAGAFFLLYLYPLARGWNAAGTWWGYDVTHSVLAAINQLGWPIALFALVGTIDFIVVRNSQGCYWVTWASLWGSATVLLPLFVTYHPAYVFPLATSVLVLAGALIGRVFDFFERKSRLVAWVWMSAACASGLPSTVSYFSDGSRHDYRAAARYVVNHWQPGDRVASVAPTLLGHYLSGSDAIVAVPGGDPVPRLEQLAKDGHRLWIVLSFSRSGKPANLQRWLQRNCAQEAEIRRPRYDYQDFTVEVFLYPPPRE